MADKTINYDLNINTAKSVNSIDSLETNLNDLRTKLKGLDVGSKEFKKMQQEVVKLDSKLKNTTKSIEGMDFEQVAGEVGKLAGGVGAVTAAFTLMGSEGDESLQEMQENMNKGLAIFMGVKGAIEGVTASIKLMRVAQVALNAAMKANPIGVIIAAVLALAAAITVFYLATRDANLELEAMNELRDKSTELMGDEYSQMKLLLAVVKNENNERKDRNKAVKELQKRYPKYLSNLSTENVSTKKIKDNVKLLNKELRKKYLTMAAEEKLTALYKDQLDILTGIGADPSFWQYTTASIKSVFKGITVTGQLTLDILNNAKELFIKNRKEINAINKVIDKFGLSLDGIIGGEGGLKVTTDNFKTMTDAANLLGQTFVHITYPSDDVRKLNKEYATLITRLNLTTKGADKVSKIEEAASNVRKDLIEQITLDLETNIRLQEEETGSIESKELLSEAIKSQVAALEELNKVQEKSKEKKKTDEIELTDFQTFWGKKEEVIMAFVDAITNAYTAMNNLSAVQTDNRIKDLEKQRDAEIEAMNNTLGIVQEEKTEEQIINEKYAALIEVEKKKQFERDKKYNYAQALMNAALAITDVWKKWGATLPIAIALSAVVTATTAAQLKAISQQTYSKGGLLVGPSHAQGGIATPYGEMEGDEAIINRMSTQKYAPLLSAINQDEGGVPISGGGYGMEDLARMIGQEVKSNMKTYVVSSDMTNQQSIDTKVFDRSKI